jgi:hypothetical protein
MRQNSNKRQALTPGGADSNGDPVKIALGPVVCAFVYKNDIVVQRRGESRQHLTRRDSSDVIQEFSTRSRRRLAFVANNCDVEFKSMMTLTYPAQWPANGRKCKSHLNALLTWLRKKYSDFAYLWFFEFQKRGAPHFHILTNVKLSGCKEHKAASRVALARRWYTIVDSQDLRHLAAGTSWENQKKPGGLTRYAVKYATKMYQKRVPPDFGKCGRFWGRSKNVKTPVKRMVIVDGATLRARLQDWPYLPGMTTPLFKHLWGAAEFYCENGNEMPAESIPEESDAAHWGEVDSHSELW